VDEAVADGLLRVEVADQLVDLDWALDEYRPLPPTRSAITANASGTFGSGTCDQPFGTGRTMLSAWKSRLFCGSSLTPFELKKSASVPVLAGVIVTGGGAGTAGAAMPAGIGVAGVTPGWPRACGV